MIFGFLLYKITYLYWFINHTHKHLAWGFHYFIQLEVFSSQIGLHFESLIKWNLFLSGHTVYVFTYSTKHIQPNVSEVDMPAVTASLPVTGQPIFAPKSESIMPLISVICTCVFALLCVILCVTLAVKLVIWWTGFYPYLGKVKGYIFSFTAECFKYLLP